jgi:hypothetical protein
MKLGYVSNGLTGVDYHRLIKPFSLIGGDITRLEGINSEVFDYNFDVIVFSRILPIRKQKEFIRELQSRGTYVICDIDDHWILNKSHVIKGVGDAFRNYAVEALMYSDEVWCTHKLLGKEVERLNANWYVIPNALDPTEEQWQPKKEYNNRIGWAGGVTHFNDLMLTDGCYSRPPVICGYQKNSEWKRLADNFQANYVEAMDVFNYGQLYDQFDIAIAPLVPNKFNTMKSNLKIIEAGLKGLPIFVQDIHPYTDDAKGIFKVNSWHEAIIQAESMEVEMVRESGQALREYVLGKYDLREVNKLREKRL